jgi:adenylylsulfate kinase
MIPAFGVWLTGLPASGKSTVAQALARQLLAEGRAPVVLESDRLRALLTPHPTYSEPERELFYRLIACFGAEIVRRGVPVIFDATANRRRWRDAARAHIPRFLEVFIDTPLDRCAARDTKGLYRAAQAGRAKTLPGLQAPYEPPAAPELRIWTELERDPVRAAARVIAELRARGWLPPDARRRPWRARTILGRAPGPSFVAD